MALSNITAVSPIGERSEATPGLFNSRFDRLFENIQSLYTSTASSEASLVGWNKGSIATTLDTSAGTLSVLTIRPSSGNTVPFTGAVSTNTIGAQSGNTIRVPNGQTLIVRSVESGGAVYDVRAFGAVGDGTTDDTLAFISANSAIVAAGHGVMFVPPGTYLTSYKPTQARIKIRGAGVDVSNLRSASTNSHPVEVTGLGFHDLVMEDLTLQPRGGSHGLYIHDNSSEPYNLTLRNVRVAPRSGHTGKGVYIPEQFATFLDAVEADMQTTSDNAIELQGGNTTVLIRCYVRGVGDNKAAYRFYKNNPVLISCNGIDSGGTADWGVFGQNMADDGVVSVCHPTLIGCNIEDYTSRGLYFKSGSWGCFYNTWWNAPPVSSASTVLPVKFDFVDNEGSNFGFMDSGCRFDTKGSAYSNGSPINSSGVPLVQVSGKATGFYYDTNLAATRSLPTIGRATSIRTLAPSALTATAANTNLRQDEVVFTVGGASGASLAIHSGGTVYYFNSDGSARVT